MSRVDLHPDDLLDPDRRRSLTPDERTRLERHLALCPACAFELAASADFARWLDHGAPDEESVAARIADRVMLALDALRPEAGGRVAAVPSRLRAPRRFVVAAVILATAATAGAAAWYLVLAPRLAPPAPAAAACPAGDADTPAPDTGRSAAPRLSPAPAGAPPARPSPPPPAPLPPPLPAAIAPSGSDTTPRPAPDVTLPPAPVVRSRVPVPGRPAEPPAPQEVPDGLGPEPTPAQLLAQANELRRTGAYVDAAGLYRELQRRYPGTREELVSRVTLGRVLLERLDDAAGALAIFDGYLTAAPGGTLAEEAWVGRALALQRLDRTDEERAAWTTVLSLFPDSAHAERARRRLAEIPDASP
ncbi:MAG: hypothetical protein HY905_08000 [Deltaproteobacteria bacterium]|nr:hypothetical protein [Deltaproteobacteria bacterium]